LFSAAASPDTEAAREFEGWRQVYATCSEAMVERLPEVREDIERRHRMVALQCALELQQRYVKERPIQRLCSAILSQSAIILHRVGIGVFAERLYARALYPNGTVGRGRV
jgi:hypothetical protein